ncbi:PREDICTED: KH homology domain-containing protein 1-like [Elephantulus edwardii]|uniref:KH homology domain-containing protein 1-like n=1 Tax=Elephantulus edwardii TaxID=28737 RepID=UPI0003F06EEA|nr:PREDICTED: KH homology domain-containing protein 1-like [Elephantulus edwardii]
MSRQVFSQEKPWWGVPGNFRESLEFGMEEEMEERIFGTGLSDRLACRIEEHSCTLIHLREWFSASGQTRVITQFFSVLLGHKGSPVL